MEDIAEEVLWINEKVQQLNVPDQSDVEQRLIGRVRWANK